MDQFDQKYNIKKDLILCGIDEAGRGPLAGPVVAAAVILPQNIKIPGVDDSKKINPQKREKLFHIILNKSITTGVGIVHEREIDNINILNATHKAMTEALSNLTVDPDLVLVDGLPAPIPHRNVKNIIKGDSKSLSIACASIVAKVTRDKMMKNYDIIFPDYGFSTNMGYGTKKHIRAIKDHWATPIHRKSFSPVKDFLPGFEHFQNRKWLGNLGEQYAAAGLVKLGYDILEMNYSIQGIGEIDIIHQENDNIVFSEVKTNLFKRRNSPLNRINKNKRDRILKTASIYLEKIGFSGHQRFDVISVQFSGEKPTIKRIKGGLSID
ncbi:MAG: ribonuclease HII [Fidelibacterota bacterium]